MKHIFLLALLCICGNIYAQDAGKDSIEDRSNALVYRYHHNGKNVIGMAKLKKIVSSNAEANEHMKKALNNYYLSVSAGAAGGFLAGYSLGALASGEPLNLPVAGAGIAGLIASHYFSNQRKFYVAQAISTYNRSRNSGTTSSSLHFNITPTNIGLQLKF